MNAFTVIPIGHAAAARNPRNAGTCDLFYIAGKLGQAHRSVAWLCRTVDALIAGEGFPAAFPLLHRGALSSGAHRASRWAMVAVDAWFDHRLPPEARAAVDQAERARIDSKLSGRAAALFMGDAA